MMDMKEVVEILKTEKKCVLRNEFGKCDRECGRCDLLMPTERILEAYTLAIERLEND